MSPHIPASRPGTPSVDPAFKTVPKDLTAFLIWRIEKLQVVPVPKEQYGSFYNGDSYVIYSASDKFERPGTNVKSRELRGHGDLRVHFWLGENTSQDEAGVAAIKSVELDDYLDGSPVQHREVQGSESERFKSYFPSGIRYLEGGVASGLKPLDMAHKPRLFHVKGKRRPIIREVREIAWKSMNDGDVFVLDTGSFIFVWIGKNANMYEKHQGSKVAQKLRSEHGGEHTVVFVDDGKEHLLPEDEKTAFSEYLDIRKITLGKATQDAASSDIVHERVSAEQLRLYRCSDAEGSFKVTEVKGGPLVQSDLNSDDSFIVDNRSNGIWVWIGKNATKTERNEAMRNAQGFINKKGYHNCTPIIRVIDGAEPIEFRALFKVWIEKDETQRPKWMDRSFNKIAPTVQTKFDAASLHEKRNLAAQYQMVDDGSGRRDIWRVVNFDLKPLNPKEYGTFYSGDCYVILYTYSNSVRECHIIYTWLGRKSTADEKGTAAAKMVEMDTKTGGGPVQVRIVQGKETPHFMAMFGGCMVIHEGGVKSGFAKSNQKDDLVDSRDGYLLHVRGSSSSNTKAVEVPRRASSLNSNDAFVLVTKTMAYMWAGKGSTGDEREAARRIATTATREPTVVFEGMEKPDFWNAIGGKEEYANEKRLHEDLPDRTPRLFHCSNASGRFIAEELVDFTQDDLVPDDVLLLDSGDAIFMWIGEGANRQEKQKAYILAEEYLRTDPKGRDINTPIIKIFQGHEPINFTGFFGVWDFDLWTHHHAEGEICQVISAHKKQALADKTNTNGNHNHGHEHKSHSHTGTGDAKYPISMLRVKDAEELPEGVDPVNKEAHLNDKDFFEVFGMSYGDFTGVPSWKKAALKKSAGLF